MSPSPPSSNLPSAPEHLQTCRLVARCPTKRRASNDKGRARTELRRVGTDEGPSEGQAAPADIVHIQLRTSRSTSRAANPLAECLKAGVRMSTNRESRVGLSVAPTLGGDRDETGLGQPRRWHWSERNRG